MIVNNIYKQLKCLYVLSYKELLVQFGKISVALKNPFIKKIYYVNIFSHLVKEIKVYDKVIPIKTGDQLFIYRYVHAIKTIAKSV